MSVTQARLAREHGDLDALVDLLGNSDYMTRWAAAQELGRLGDPAAIGPLVRALQAADDGLRNSAIKALVAIGGTTAIPALLEVATTDPASAVRTTAIDALAVLDDPRGIDMLVDLALDPRPATIVTSERNIRPAEGGRLFARVVSTKDQEIAHVRRWALKRLRELRATRALARLEAAPRPRSPRTRLALFRTLRTLRGG